MGDVKILVVDDEERMRKLVRDFLVKKGFLVIEASNGEEAYNLFTSTNDISLIIMDVMMPKMDGYETSEEIRKLWDSHWLTNMGVEHKELQHQLEEYLQ